MASTYGSSFLNYNKISKPFDENSLIFYEYLIAKKLQKMIFNLQLT